MSLAFALYRLPHTQTCIKVEGEVQEFKFCSQLSGVSGFVIAPFEIRADQPIVVIRPDRVTESVVSHSCLTSIPASHAKFVKPSSSYAIDFANFHAQLEQGLFHKIVLARCAFEPAGGGLTPEQLFYRACQLYPRLFIALVYTPQSGMWLTATPEILLDGEAGSWRTIALAGTMKLEGDALNGEGETATWSTKNIEEQRIVATYIAECLEQFTSDFREEGPRTVRAANLVHLRSDFTFTLPASNHIGDLLQALHPTPAVCGLPKREAFRFIIDNEYAPRRYYSGFMGPLNMCATVPAATQVGYSATATHLYVSLRCMSIDAAGYHLYAGGGLLRDSQLEQEWQETEAKLETMRRLINERIS